MGHASFKYQRLCIYAALFCMGYVACLFLTYGFVVMPGLATIDDTSFVAAFQGLETRFQSIDNQSHLKSAVSFGNIPALIAFPGAMLFAIMAILFKWKGKCVLWLMVALALFGTGMITTVMYKLPSNEFIFNAGNPNVIDTTKVRAEFNEASWAIWNHFRTATTSLAFLCLLRAVRLLNTEIARDST